MKIEGNRQKKVAQSKKKANRGEKHRKYKLFILYKPEFGNVNEFIFTQ